ncbi:MAG TPA: lysozyme [Methanosarcina sp.]|nr:lysozyme [Methanosarcina sp.]
MEYSNNGLELTKSSESFSAKAYKDSGGVWTVGWGTTRINGRPVNKDDVVDELYALVLLKEDVASACETVNRLVTVPLNQNQFDALVDFVYNLGEEQFARSTLLKKLNAKDYVGASNEFQKWVFDNGQVLKGLVVRRAKEKALFNK